MKPKLLMSMAVCAALYMAATAVAEKIDPVTLDVIPEAQDMLYNRAPKPLPWIAPEMMNVEYWVKRMAKPDEVVLSRDRIMAMNAAYQKRAANPGYFASLPDGRRPEIINWWPGFNLSFTDLFPQSPAAVADTVRTRIGYEIAYLHSREYANAQGIKYSAEQIAGFEAEMAFKAIPSRVTPKAGITVRTARLMNIPTFLPEQVGMTQAGKMRWGQFNILVVKIAEPVTVLHTSASGEYVFVETERAYGWLRSEEVAVGTREAIAAFGNPKDFIVCTGDRVNFYTDTNCTTASGWFGMGARLPLASVSNPRIVNVPVRRTNGSLATETAWVKNDGNVSVGYLPYTRRNIVTVAFRLMDNPYDWSGAWYGRQHESTYWDIFACFGFKLPNHGTLFTFFNDNNTSVLQPEMGKDGYYRAINANPPFVTIQSCGGHCQLYLGDDNGRPIVFDQHGYGYQDENEEWFEVRRTNVGDLRLPRYFLLREVTFLELR